VFFQRRQLYNALQVDVNRRFSAGLTLRGVYTFSKVLDDGDSSTRTRREAVRRWLPSHSIALRLGLVLERAHVAVINASYALHDRPWQAFARDAQDMANNLVGGWRPLDCDLQGGFPFSPQLSYNPSGNGDTRNPVAPIL